MKNVFCTTILLLMVQTTFAQKTTQFVFDLAKEFDFIVNTALLNRVPPIYFKFTPNGNEFVVRKATNTFSLRSFPEGNLIKTFNGVTFSFSSDRRKIAVAKIEVPPNDDRQVDIIDMKTGLLLHRIPFAFPEISDVAFTSNGNQLVILSNDHSLSQSNLQLFDIKKETKLIYEASFQGHKHRIFFIDQETLLIIGSLENIIWNVLEKKIIRSFKPPPRLSGKAIILSPDKRYLLEVGFRFSSVFNAKTGEEIQHFSFGFPMINGFTFSPNSHEVWFGSDDGFITGWDIKTGKKIGRMFLINDGYFATMKFSPDGKQLLTLGLNGVLRLWNYIHTQTSSAENWDDYFLNP